MTTYYAPVNVSGEYATADGLVSYDYEAGDITPNGDEAILEHLVSLGIIQAASPKPVSKTTTKAAAIPADAQEEK